MAVPEEPQPPAPGSRPPPLHRPATLDAPPDAPRPRTADAPRAAPAAPAAADDDEAPAAAAAARPAAPRSASSSDADDDDSTGSPLGASAASFDGDIGSEDGEDGGAARGAGASSESDEGYAEVLARFRELASLRDRPAAAAASAASAAAPPLASRDLAGVAALITAGRAERIVVMVGAGASVSAGIPDFRTPGTGLYSRLGALGLPHPQAVFELDFFRRNPRPFWALARELFPGAHAPTPAHHLLRLLHDRGLLRRVYTQNIDSLEAAAGLPREAVVAAHGNFDAARCVACRAEHAVARVRAAVEAQEPCRCTETPRCRGLVKPDIVFFGESLPERFWRLAPGDLAAADLLIVMGTSLVVQPFASLLDRVGPAVPRLLVNRERVGEAAPELRALGYEKGFDFDAPGGRDALFLGDCDDGARALAEALGWAEDLEALVAAGAVAHAAAKRGAPEGGGGDGRGLEDAVEAVVAAAGGA